MIPIKAGTAMPSANAMLRAYAMFPGPGYVLGEYRRVPGPTPCPWAYAMSWANTAVPSV